MIIVMNANVIIVAYVPVELQEHLVWSQSGLFNVSILQIHK